MIYELDPDYDKNLTENKFLVDYKFADEELRLINADGHLIDVDESNTERLIDENGRFVAYSEDDEQYFVNRDGEEVNPDGSRKVEFAPFLDDDGNPVEAEIDSDEEPEAEETTAETPEDAEEASEKPKTRGRPKKTAQKA